MKTPQKHPSLDQEMQELILACIADGKIQRAIETLLEIKSLEQEVRDEVLVLSSNWTELTKGRRLNTIHYSEAEVRQSQITKALVDLVSSLSKKNPMISDSFSENSSGEAAVKQDGSQNRRNNWRVVALVAVTILAPIAIWVIVGKLSGEVLVGQSFRKPNLQLANLKKPALKIVEGALESTIPSVNSIVATKGLSTFEILPDSVEDSILPPLTKAVEAVRRTWIVRGYVYDQEKRNRREGNDRIAGIRIYGLSKGLRIPNCEVETDSLGDFTLQSSQDSIESVEAVDGMGSYSQWTVKKVRQNKLCEIPLAKMRK